MNLFPQYELVGITSIVEGSAAQRYNVIKNKWKIFIKRIKSYERESFDLQ